MSYSMGKKMNGSSLTREAVSQWVELINMPSTKRKLKTRLAKLKERGINMKATGIVRKVDELGRLVIPIELRRSLDIDVKDSIEVFVDGDKIILRKYQPNEDIENAHAALQQLMGEVTEQQRNLLTDVSKGLKALGHAKV